ncbi:hypothetical protein Ancab_005242 [Ancistrocladus abbreviatus]
MKQRQLHIPSNNGARPYAYQQTMTRTIAEALEPPVPNLCHKKGIDLPPLREVDQLEARGMNPVQRQYQYLNCKHCTPNLHQQQVWLVQTDREVSSNQHPA